MLQTKPKPPRCKFCKRRTDSIGRKLCEECVTPWLEKEKAKKARFTASVDRAQVREFREKNKTIADRIREAQVEFNRFIKLRDRLAGHSCISSGRPLDWSGNAVDAGHFRSTGAASALRYSEANCHAQSKHDNRYLGGNIGNYRLGLIARIGLPAVEALEADSAVHKWTHAELIAIKALYRQKAKELEKTCAQ